MDEMDINPLYPKPNLSKRLKQAQSFYCSGELKQDVVNDMSR